MRLTSRLFRLCVSILLSCLLACSCCRAYATLHANYRLLLQVSASDGLWEFMTSQEVADMVAKYESPEEATNELIKEAKTRWLREEEVIDDTTVVVACVGKWRGGGADGTS